MRARACVKKQINLFIIIIFNKQIYQSVDEKRSANFGIQCCDTTRIYFIIMFTLIATKGWADRKKKKFATEILNICKQQQINKNKDKTKN